MTKYHFIYAIWLLPLYFLSMNLYQLNIYTSISKTWESGESYMADIADIEIKQIAAQTNGYVVLQFEPEGGPAVRETLSMPVQMIQTLLQSNRVPIRYLPDSSQDIVVVPTYNLQRQIIRVNLGVTLIGLIATGVIAWFASRFARRRILHGEEKLIIERIDQDD